MMTTHTIQPPDVRVVLAWRAAPGVPAVPIPVTVTRGATVADLAAVLGADGSADLLIDGVRHEATSCVPVLRRGTEVSPADGVVPPSPGGRPAVAWRWRTGSDAGRCVPLRPGRWLVGSGRAADLRAQALAPAQAELDVPERGLPTLVPLGDGQPVELLVGEVGAGRPARRLRGATRSTRSRLRR